MRSPDDKPIPFDEILAMIQDVAQEGKLFNVMSRVLNDENIKDSRKLMMVQVIGFGYASKFTALQYNALTLLLGYYSRKIEIPRPQEGEKVTPLWGPRTIALKVRGLASEITKDEDRRIGQDDAKRILSLAPFLLDEKMREKILREIYPEK